MPREATELRCASNYRVNIVDISSLRQQTYRARSTYRLLHSPSNIPHSEFRIPHSELASAPFRIPHSARVPRGVNSATVQYEFVPHTTKQFSSFRTPHSEFLILMWLSRRIKKLFAYRQTVFCLCALLFVAIFALLVSDTTACLASRLARGLALTATTVLCAFAKVCCVKSLNMFHFLFLRDVYLHKKYIITLT